MTIAQDWYKNRRVIQACLIIVIEIVSIKMNWLFELGSLALIEPGGFRYFYHQNTWSFITPI